ncbi:MAG TPA: hypothetical protein VLT88_00630 [Desulfosarcina sp.]|nr:hypothetical protein [Desulfosarcina sp.]
MERRTTDDRRQDHLYVADERRAGPYDRRNADARLQQREAERAKIERIRSFKQKDRNAAHATPLLTKKRLLILTGVLLAAVGMLLLIR